MICAAVWERVGDAGWEESCGRREVAESIGEGTGDVWCKFNVEGGVGCGLRWDGCEEMNGWLWRMLDGEFDSEESVGWSLSVLSSSITSVSDSVSFRSTSWPLAVLKSATG